MENLNETIAEAHAKHLSWKELFETLPEDTQTLLIEVLGEELEAHYQGYDYRADLGDNPYPWCCPHTWAYEVPATIEGFIDDCADLQECCQDEEEEDCNKSLNRDNQTLAILGVYR